jgi:hypothetical protein
MCRKKKNRKEGKLNGNISVKPYIKPPHIHTSFADSIAFSLGEDTATWHATSFNAASEDILGLLGLTPSFFLQPEAPQWQS